MVKVETKRARVLAALLNGEKHTRFTAERELHDHCLHSTVAELQRSYGIRISRKFITISGYMGSPTRCCLYWIDPDEIARYMARKMKTSSKGGVSAQQFNIMS